MIQLAWHAKDLNLINAQAVNLLFWKIINSFQIVVLDFLEICRHINVWIVEWIVINALVIQFAKFAQKGTNYKIINVILIVEMINVLFLT